MLAVLQLSHQPLILVFAQQVAADCRRVQVPGIQVNQRVVPLVRCRSFDTFGSGAGKRIIHLAAGQQQTTDGTIPGELLPVAFAELVSGDLRHRRPLAAAPFNQAQFDTHPMGRPHQDFVDDHDGYRGTGQPIHRHLGIKRSATHGNPLVSLQPGVLVGKDVQLAFGDTHQQDGLIVVDNLGGLDGAFGIQHNHRIDRLTGIGGSLHKIQTLVGIAQQFVAGTQLLDRPVAFPGGDVGYLGKRLLNHLASGQRLILLQRHGASQTSHQTQNPGQNPDNTAYKIHITPNKTTVWKIYQHEHHTRPVS